MLIKLEEVGRGRMEKNSRKGGEEERQAVEETKTKRQNRRVTVWKWKRKGGGSSYPIHSFVSHSSGDWMEQDTMDSK